MKSSWRDRGATLRRGNALWWRRWGPALLGLTGMLMSNDRPGWAVEQSPKPDAPFHYDSKGHRDPFIPLVMNGRTVGMPKNAGRESTKPVLYGILWDPGGLSIALINDGEVKVGDTIDGYRVVEIRRDAVVVTNGGEPITLEISFGASSAPGTTMGGEDQ